MADIRFLMTLGWVNQLMAWVDHTKYFWPGVTLVLNRIQPNFEIYLEKPTNVWKS